MKRILFISLFVLFVFNLSAQRKVRKETHKGDTNYREQRYGAAEEKYKAAIEKYTDSKVVKEEEKSKEAFYNLGNTYYRQGRWDEAVEGYGNYQKLETDPLKQSSSWSNIGNSYLHKAIEKAPPKDPSQQQAQGGSMEQPEQLPRMEDLNKSMDAYKNALRLNPVDQEARYNLATVQKMIKDQNDKNKDDKQDNKQDKQDKKEEQKKDKKEDPKQDDKKEEQPKENQMSQENIEQILNAIEQDERETQGRVQKQKAEERKQMNARNKKHNKDW